ncbi:uncharacterized protein FA14DRAFT_187570 [Meira miltonrushii]|uniref:Uncharacterized protein n=1 Tax=Meira miltonrushii TaxID=1280837 RepID=A0A316VIU5_9BASI|nr:uncharacterized protein FA14DRAFT_187570 [Meira miltonrushii]PWN37466.1 hypothetical protein FA14DRAFT_187570 [Meira miltonrushii]
MTINIQSMLQSIFGCCLGRRQGESSTSAFNQSGSQNDERTPLLRQDQISKPGTDSKQSGSEALIAGTSGSNKGHRDTKEIVKQRKEIDLSRLKSIREHAQSAFFNVDSSQLLPSTEAMTKNKTKLEAMWKNEDIVKELDDTGDSTQVAFQPQSNIQSSSSDENRHDQRFEAKQTIDRRKEITEKLKGAVQQPMAETWEENSLSEAS